MKEIGERLKETRESIGISLEEAAEDLKMKVNQLENIEEGNMEVFKDIFYLKYFIRDYAKYLGLDYEDVVDEFNEYLFDYTSKISIEDIKKAKQNIKVEDKTSEKKISSPYTIEHESKPILPRLFLYILIITVLGYILFTAYNYIQNQNENDTIVAMYTLD